MKVIKRYSGTVGFVIFVLIANTLVPPVIHRLRHLCPVKSDGIQEAKAMPNWARRYGVDCTMCHTSYPRLNKVGYMFRAAGFRWPDDIGKPVDVKNLTDFVAVRGRLRYNYASKMKGGAVAKSNNGLRDGEVTFYPGTGAYDPTYSGLFELSNNPEEENLEAENAYVKGTWGKPDLFFTLKGGIFHPFEGFGASDRVIGNLRPLFQVNPANNGQGTLFKIWGIDQVGVEAGASFKDSRLTLTIFNGFNGDTGKVEQFGKNDQKDLQLFFNQFIGDGAISLYYYNGSADLQGPAVSTATWNNSFQRFAFYAYYPVLKYFDVLGGYMRGKDDVATGAANQETVKDGIFHSEGYFFGLESVVNQHFAVTTRFDYFDPSQDKANNTMRAGTLGLYFPFGNIRYAAEYQYISTDSVPESIQNKITLEWQFIF